MNADKGIGIAMYPSHETKLREIADDLRAMVGPGVGFTLLLGVGRSMFSVSNIERADAMSALSEWLQKTEDAIGDEEAAPMDAPAEQRILERRCGEIGRRIGAVSDVILFLFTFGEDGYTAYFTNVPHARADVAAWLASVRSRS